MTYRRITLPPYILYVTLISGADLLTVLNLSNRLFTFCLVPNLVLLLVALCRSFPFPHSLPLLFQFNLPLQFFLFLFPLFLFLLLSFSPSLSFSPFPFLPLLFIFLLQRLILLPLLLSHPHKIHRRRYTWTHRNNGRTITRHTRLQRFRVILRRRIYVRLWGRHRRLIHRIRPRIPPSRNACSELSKVLSTRAPVRGPGLM